VPENCGYNVHAVLNDGKMRKFGDASIAPKSSHENPESPGEKEFIFILQKNATSKVSSRYSHSMS